jgi:hypothetical protein
MSTAQYAVWCPDEGEQEHDDEELIVAYDAEAAACDFVERRHRDDPFDEPMVVQTRGPFGERMAYSVHP